MTKPKIFIVNIHFKIMEQELVKLGLTDKEAKLYLLCLKIGETSANRLIELSGFPRGTTYNILERLKLNGFVSSFVVKKTTHFIANNPNILVKNLEEKKIEAKRLIPKLKSIQGKIERKIKIETFEGLGGVKNVLDEIIDSAKSCIIMGNEEKATEIIMHHPLNFKARRIENKIKIKNLLEGSKLAKSLKNDKYTQVRHIQDLTNSEVLLILYRDVVVHIILTEPITTIKITSDKYSKDQKIIFEQLWKQAKK